MSNQAPAFEPDERSELRAVIERIRSGDEEAARELLCRYESEVRLVVRRQLPRLLRSRFDSLDFLQSVWGSFFQRLKSDDSGSEFENGRHLVAFLAKVARNKVIDQSRRAGSQKQDMKREEPLWSDGGRPREISGREDSPSEVAGGRETLDRLLSATPADRREIVALKARGLSSREIGDRLGMSERTVQRVIEELRRRFDSDESK